ncbi:MAG TPA: PD-(D/E)XK nuclease family protein [Anaeromyxobacteraceae bacterium]
MRALPLDSEAAWARAVIDLPPAGPLPSRTVLVPSERHAHALRRALARSGSARALAGTRLVGPLTAAIEVLHAAGVAVERGEEALRPARLLSLFREDLLLEHFDLDLLRSTRGWDEAFARAIATLEAAGLSPADLPRDTAHARDLALLWSRAAAEAGGSLTSARVYLEAAALLAREPGAWPFQGPTLASVTGHEDVALARFVRAIPVLTLGVWTARPPRRRHLERLEALFGVEARGALTGTISVEAERTERDLLSAFLFQPVEVLAAPDRPRSRGPDGTVHLEEHAGVEAELEAAAGWVAQKVLEEKLPLEEIAVLVPAQDPLAQLVAERLERLPFDGRTLPVHVAGGLPAISTAAGARLLAVIRALEAHLSAETLAAVLPAVRIERPPRPSPAGEGAPRPATVSHLTHGEAMELAFSLGTAGGNAARPEGALEWSPRAAARAPELEAALARARLDEDSAAREALRIERTLRNLRAVRPALEALVGVARALVGGAPLAALWDALRGFLDEWLLMPGEGAALPGRLAESLAPACARSLGERLTGPDALVVIRDRLLALRVSRGRFGEPAVYVGTVAGAAGLGFAAVRVIGLCEGVLPSQPREDPVLPERLRAALEAGAPGRILPSADDHVAAQVDALFRAVQGARDSVVLSAPNVDLTRTEREPASLFIEAAAALGRPDAASGAPAPVVPDTAALRRDAFRPAREAAAAFRAAHPISDAAWLDRVSRTAPELPPAWAAEPALALDRVGELRLRVGPLGPADGVLGPGEPFPALPGIDPARPISASALQQLVQCPRMFLMRRILGWEAPAAAPPLRELDALSYGSLLHRVVEAFYRTHGADFVARRRSLAYWLETALALGDRLFHELLSEYPLVGEGIREKERERLRESLRAFLEYDWEGPSGRKLVGVELPFGERTPLAIPADGVTLHTRGFIDRVDVEGGATLVRDLKSGRAHPRRGDEAGPTPFRDVQLGLYQLAAKQLASEWGTPPDVIAAYAYASGRGDAEERAFRADAGSLESATREWLATAAHLLSARAFPPTPDEGDCGFCPFHPLCGAESARRAAAGLDEADDGTPLARFRTLKLGEEDEE